MAAFTVNLADLQFILDQIRIAEAHASGTPLTDLIPDPHVPWGLRTVDGSYNNIIPGREQWGAADTSMPRLLQPNYLNDTDGDVMPLGGPGGPAVTNNNYGVIFGNPTSPAVNGGHTGNVADADPRLISNLVVDMSLNNPAAIVAALTFAGSEDVQGDLQRILAAKVTAPQAAAALAAAQAAVASAEAAVATAVSDYSASPSPVTLDGIQDAAEALSVAEAALERAVTTNANPAGAQRALAEELGLEFANGSLIIPNVAADEGLSAPFNAWMTFFGQFFDHGLDLITKGGNGTIFVPLAADDPLVTHGPDGIAGNGDEVPASTRFMTLTRANTTADGSQNNITTSFVDQNQTYTSHASHQVFLREYKMVDGKPVATGRLLGGADGEGLATWADIKAQARDLLGIELSDLNVLNVPLLVTDAYGNFIPNAAGFPQVVTGFAVPSGDFLTASGTPGSPVILATLNGGAGPVLIDHAFLDDIAHNAAPMGDVNRDGIPDALVADADTSAGLANSIVLSNNSFEADSMATGAPNVVTDPTFGNYALINPQGWTVTGFGGLFAPTAAAIAVAGHTGGNVVFLDNGATLTRDTGAVLVQGSVYKVSFNVGDRLDQPFGGGFARLLTSDGLLLAEVALPTPATNGTWTPVTLATGAISATDAGKGLRIEFVQSGVSGAQILIDNVTFPTAGTYDNELLDAHYITGDGRGNENIGLTAVHHIFHSEHNRQVEAQKIKILSEGDLAFVNDWMSTSISAAELASIKSGLAGAVNKAAFLDALEDGNLLNGVAGLDLNWNGERLFQAARFATEMQYQHLVFEEFARKVQPAIDVFVFNNITDVDASIFSEFANTVYRFGHSMLTEDIPLVTVDGVTTEIGLIQAFLNPFAFDALGDAEKAAGDIVRGMTTVRGNEIDEFITGALRNNLLGLPLDLAAINIARGRDTGMPSLNDARTQLYAASASTFLEPYDNWVDFAANLKNPASVINFIAAYGTHSSIVDKVPAPVTPANPSGLRDKTSAEKRDAATALVTGIATGTATVVPADRLDFLNSTNGWGTLESGLNLIDLWIGGLAEKKMPFGGMLGSTFNAIFELQLENLQDGDRLYYLTRTQGQNMLNALEQNSFAKMIMANTDIADAGLDGLHGTADDIVKRHIGVDSFADYDFVLEVDAANQFDYNGAAPGVDPTGGDATLEAIGRGKVQRDDPTTPGVDTNFLRFTGGEHVVAGGTAGDDTIITDFGDDGIWGDGGNDRIESGAGVDLVNGGAGDDILTDSGDTGDFIKGDEGDDVISNSNGIDILMGGSGKDVIFVGVDSTEVFGGEGDDFILGGDGVDLLLGNEGDDWIEAGGGFDTTAGDNSELFFDSAIIGHDVMFAGNEEHDFDAESGDDIMVQGESVMRNEGMFGFDWAIYKDMAVSADADLRTPIFTTEQADTLRNRFDKVEALSGWDKDDILRGDDRVFDVIPPGATVGTTENVFFNDALDAAGLARIDGLDAIVNLGPTGLFERGNVLLGGAGSDLIQGNGGDDIIDGDRWLNVRIRITDPGEANLAANEIATIDSMRHVFTAAEMGTGHPWVGKSLSELLIARVIVPNQMHIVREVLDSEDTAAVDVAVFNDVLANYTIADNGDGSFTVTQNAVTVGVIDPVTERALVSDGVDIVRNVEVLRFADQDVELSRPELQLHAFNAQDLRDNFNTVGYSNSTGATPWGTTWAEVGDGANAVNGGQIQIAGGQLRFAGSATAGVSDGAEISRVVDLGSARSATVSFTAVATSIEAGEVVRYQFAADGVNFVTYGSISTNGTQPITFDVIDGPFTSAARIRFVATSMNQANDIVTIDNLVITPLVPDPAATANFETTFTEDGAQATIANRPGIVETSDQIAFARVVLTNAQAGDVLTTVGTLPFGIIRTIDTTQAGQVTLLLTGPGSAFAFEAAIAAVRFSSTSQNPSTVDRIINVTVNDGFLNSNVATATVNVVAVNDAPNAVTDNLITNFAGPFVVPEWLMLLNDTDAEGSPLDVTAATENDASFSITFNGGDVTATRTDADNTKDFTYTISDGTLTDTADVDITYDTVGALDGTGGADILLGNDAASTLNGNGGNDTIVGGRGNDTIDGGTGDDTIYWNANATGTTDGRDLITGGTETAAGPGDTFVINGNALAEVYRIYTRAAFAAVAGNTLAGINAQTEIIVTRGGTNAASIIAELREIEEIRVNTLQVTTPGGAGGGVNGGDTIQVIGNFAATSLNFNTITIDGSAADDTVDISSLGSAHRIVFRSNGGNDTIVGTLRAQDVIEVPEGSDPASYQMASNANGTKTLSNGTHSITFTGDVAPQLEAGNSDDDDDDETENEGNNDDDDNDGDDEPDNDEDGDSDDEETDDDEDDDGQPTTPTPNPNTGSGTGLPFVVYLGLAGGAAVGTNGVDILSGIGGDDSLFGMDGNDTLTSGAGDDYLAGDGGDDVLMAGDGDDIVYAGAGNDMVFGGAGADRIWGGDGNDRLAGDGGDDVIDGGAGNDIFEARKGDGDDVYIGGLGTDTIDFQGITANLTIKLGSNGVGSASSSQTGLDTLDGIENVKGGTGNDVIHAGAGGNVLNGGVGNDTFVFGSAAAADGDRIEGFTTGDKIDLTPFMPLGGTIVGNSTTFNANGQVKLVFANGDTTVHGSTDLDGDAEFSFVVAGKLLTDSDFV